MPKETFWPAASVEGDGSEPTFTVTWGSEVPGVYLNGIYFERSALNRLVRVIRRARDASFGSDE